MGHYLAEMEDDGVPGIWKLGRSSEPRKRDKYPIIKCVCTQRSIEKRFGVSLTWDQVDSYLAALEARRPALDALAAEHDSKLCEVYREALSSVIGGASTPSRAEGA